MSHVLSKEEIEFTEGIAIEVQLVGSSRVLDLIASHRALAQQLEVTKATLDTLAHPCNSPCGHSSQYAYSEDGGKLITCLICRAIAAEREAADAIEWRKALDDAERGRDELQRLVLKLADTTWEALDTKNPSSYMKLVSLLGSKELECLRGTREQAKETQA